MSNKKQSLATFVFYCENDYGDDTVTHELHDIVLGRIQEYLDARADTYGARVLVKDAKGETPGLIRTDGPKLSDNNEHSLKYLCKRAWEESAVA